MPLAELIIVLFAILAIATPVITLVLLGKYKKLRENFDQLAEENSRQHASLQREVADLKRQPRPAHSFRRPSDGHAALVGRWPPDRFRFAPGGPQPYLCDQRIGWPAPASYQR